MTDDVFKGQKKLRKASLMDPPNLIKEKVGSGGLNPLLLERAQDVIDNNTVDFAPIGKELLELLGATIKDVQAGKAKGEEAISAVIYPAMQLKAQGGMFHYPLMSALADVLVNFLETVETLDEDAMRVIIVHKTAFDHVMRAGIKSEKDAAGQALQSELLKACARYYKSRDLL
ncbi:MAG: hypothetical protein GC185_06610 [Alphaproteobacteria bacterium]|nr:hypothetical protein [Alphaproteobacteria bacterium]